MKILIKAHEATYALVNQNHYGNHIGQYWNFLHYNIWKSLGHEVKFIGEKEVGDIITNKHEGCDVLFFRGYNAFNFELEFGKKILKEFKGRKILYLEGGERANLGQYFDTVFIPEVESHRQKWLKTYPNKDIRLTAWTSAEFDLVDKIKENPYKDKKYRIIFTGTYNTRFLIYLKKLAELGENVVLGGIYYDGKICRGFSREEAENLHPNIELIDNWVVKDNQRYGVFQFGAHFPYLLHADLGVSFYPYHAGFQLNSKIVEYLNCGLSVVCENTMPNHYRVTQYNAGTIVKWENFDELYKAIQKEKKLRRNKKEIMDKARYFHDPVKICKEILK